MINPKNNDVNNDVTIVGTDFFTDSESFLNELTDDELHQAIGGGGHGGGHGGGGHGDVSNLTVALCGDQSGVSLLACD